MQKFDPIYLKALLQDFDERLRGLDKRKITCEVVIMYERECLFKFQNSGDVLSVFTSNNLSSDIRDVADKSGVYDLHVEFSPGSKFKTSDRIVDPLEREFKARAIPPGFSKWFVEVCSSLGNRIYLIPDTNFVRRLYYSNYLREILSGSES